MKAGDQNHFDGERDRCRRPDTGGEGEVYLTLITDDGELRFDAKQVKDGVYEVVIPSSATKNLEAGSYAILKIPPAKGRFLP